LLKRVAGYYLSDSGKKAVCVGKAIVVKSYGKKRPPVKGFEGGRKSGVNREGKKKKVKNAGPAI